MRKVIFLDIDDVLNTSKLAFETGGYPWPAETRGKGTREENPDNSERKLEDHPGIGMVRELCKRTGAEIVLHSTWRQSVDPKRFARDWDIPVVDVTDRHATKPASIRMWLDQHPEVEKMTILDNDPMSTTEDGRVPPEQVLVNAETGLTEADVARAEEMLK